MPLFLTDSCSGLWLAPGRLERWWKEGKIPGATRYWEGEWLRGPDGAAHALGYVAAIDNPSGDDPREAEFFLSGPYPAPDVSLLRGSFSFDDFKEAGRWIVLTRSPRPVAEIFGRVSSPPADVQEQQDPVSVVAETPLETPQDIVQQPAVEVEPPPAPEPRAPEEYYEDYSRDDIARPDNARMLSLGLIIGAMIIWLFLKAIS